MVLPKIQDHRSLLGAISLLVTGGILASMLSVYLDAIADGPGLPRSRLWWELVLNLQILSAALMWFCYSDRIDNTSGTLRRLQRVRRLFGMITVLVPTAFGVFGIFESWYTFRPQPQTVTFLAILVLLFWLSGLWVHMLVQRRRRTPPKPRSPWYRIVSLTPVIILALVFLVDYPSGGQTWLLAIPVLTYLQGAVPFIVRAFGLK